VEVGFRVVQPIVVEGPGKALEYLALEDVKDTIVADGLLTPDEVERMYTELVPTPRIQTRSSVSSVSSRHGAEQRADSLRAW
jgi:hypothetical protein